MKPLADDAWRYINYLNFKAQCMADQEALRWKLDVASAKALLERLEEIEKDKHEALIKAMPKKAILKAINRPKVMFKMDGSLSSHGLKFEALRKDNGQPEDVPTFNVIDKYEDGNPSSTIQVKDWLMGLGWKPCTFDYKRTPEGDTRTVPQVRQEGELTDSVLRLAKREPSVKLLAGLSVVQHRKAIVKGMLDSVDQEGFVYAGSHGLTNTLRFKHVKPLVNLPGIHKEYGKEIRGLLVAPEGHVLCGSDMDSLENNTKLHYMWDHDEEYAKAQQVKGFDPHLDLAKFAGAVTQDEIDRYVKGEYDLTDLRKAYKVTNYSATYGIKPLGLSRRGGFSVKDAEDLLDAFWSRNWSLEAIARAVRTKKTRDGQMWLFNPVSKFWYSLRHEKDKFSTLNQGTGVFCFDTWLCYCRGAGLKAIGQFHDEAIFLVKDGEEEDVSSLIKQAMDKTNKKLGLNVQLSTTPEFGNNYSEIH